MTARGREQDRGVTGVLRDLGLGTGPHSVIGKGRLNAAR